MWELVLLERRDDVDGGGFGDGGAVKCEAGERVGGLAGDGRGHVAAEAVEGLDFVAWVPLTRLISQQG